MSRRAEYLIKRSVFIILAAAFFLAGTPAFCTEDIEPISSVDNVRIEAASDGHVRVRGEVHGEGNSPVTLMVKKPAEDGSSQADTEIDLNDPMDTIDFCDQVSSRTPQSDGGYTYNFEFNYNTAVREGIYSFVIGSTNADPYTCEIQLFELSAADCNGDGRWDAIDLTILSLAYGSTAEIPDGRWDERADLNNDGKVDLEDFMILRQNYDRE